MKTESINDVIRLLRSAQTLDELIAIIETTEYRMFIYRSIYNTLLDDMHLVNCYRGSLPAYYTCYDLIANILRQSPYFEGHTLSSKEYKYISRLFIELNRRKPWWALVTSKYRWWARTRNGNYRRLIVLNECIVECLKIILWEKHLRNLQY